MKYKLISPINIGSAEKQLRTHHLKGDEELVILDDRVYLEHPVGTTPQGQKSAIRHLMYEELSITYELIRMNKSIFKQI